MYRWKIFLRVCLSVVLAAACCIWIKVARLSRFADIEGKRTYFLDSASSQGLQKSSLDWMDIARVKGECVYTEISVCAGGRYLTKDEIAEEIIKKYGAEVLFCEEVSGVLSYYAYTDAWADGVYIYGRKINLHVAVGDEYLAVGTPIVFGGY